MFANVPAAQRKQDPVPNKAPTGEVAPQINLPVCVACLALGVFGAPFFLFHIVLSTEHNPYNRQVSH